MKIIYFILMLEAGLIPDGHLKLYESGIDVHAEMSFYTDAGIEINMFNNHVFIGGNFKIYFWKKQNNYGFTPDATNFIFYTGLRFNNLEFGWRHYCKHPIIPWHIDNNINFTDLRWEQAYDEIYIKIKAEIGNNKINIKN